MPTALNQYSQISVPSEPSVVPTYEADGNQLASQIRPLGASNLESCLFVWDGENRLIEIKDAAGATTLASYTYDSQSRRIARTVGGTTLATIYDGWNPIAEYQSTTTPATAFNLHATYLWGLDLSGSMQGAGGVGGLLSVTSGSTSFYPTYDGNGNVSEYLDATGAIAAHYEYDAFGNIIFSSGAFATSFRHRFSTKPQDEESGLYYYGYRYYDPVTGRWPSRDPIGEKGGVNLYAFVGNNGLSRFDILGLEDGEKTIVVTEVGEPRMWGADLAIINPNDPNVKEQMEKHKITAEELAKKIIGEEGQVILCGSHVEFLKQAEALKLKENSQKVVIIDHGQARIEGDGNKVVPVYPQVGGQPVTPESPDGKRVLGLLTKISKTLIICNCKCGITEKDSKDSGLNLSLSGIFGTYKNMCGSGGVKEVYVYSGDLHFEWQQDGSGELTVDVEPTVGDQGGWRKIGPE
ncbi:MAG: hypothetical protein MUF31_10050 [Akkermansiaceae bacterium]|nr:hypothetical protein [Akkermansiaceae bacterium]